MFFIFNNGNFKVNIKYLQALHLCGSYPGKTQIIPSTLVKLIILMFHTLYAPGVDFLSVELSEIFIEIALSNVAVRPT